MTAENGGDDVFPRVVSEPVEHGGEDELRRVVEKAQKGDTTVLPELRRLLDHNPGLWRQVGDLARHAETALIELAAGDNLMLRESLTRKLEELKAELAPDSPLERLLAERVAANWLAVNYADTIFGQTREDRAARAEQLRRRQDSSNRRFLEALKCFATVRRLLGPRVGQAPRTPSPAAGQKEQ
jgi:hypothetical protein